MNTRDHSHKETFDVPQEDLFRILLRPSAIRKWWGAARAVILPEAGGIWAAAWGEDEDNPDYVTIAEITELTFPHSLRLEKFRYHSKAGPLPFEAEFTIDFAVEPCEGGASLGVRQSGFPVRADADEYYEACIKGWADTFAGIRRYFEK